MKPTILRYNDMNEKELKMGDEVEVLIDPYRDIWDKKIFVKLGNCGSIIVVSAYSTYEFKHGESFSTKQYYSKWRIPKQKTYRPFTWEEREQLRGEWVKWKGADTEHFITTITKTHVILMEKNDEEWVTFQELCDNCIFVDSGLPCGVEVTK